MPPDPSARPPAVTKRITSGCENAAARGCVAEASGIRARGRRSIETDFRPRGQGQIDNLMVMDTMNIQDRPEEKREGPGRAHRKQGIPDKLAEQAAPRGGLGSRHRAPGTFSRNSVDVSRSSHKNPTCEAGIAPFRPDGYQI